MVFGIVKKVTAADGGAPVGRADTHSTISFSSVKTTKLRVLLSDGSLLDELENDACDGDSGTE